MKIRLGVLIMTCSAAAIVMSQAQPATTYTISKSVPIGAPDRWDYVVFNGQTQRVYIAHSAKLAVIDARSGDLVGEVEGIPGGTHGTAISAATGQGFTDDGFNGLAVAFDVETDLIEQATEELCAEGIVSNGDEETGERTVLQLAE